ncbi:hypothetical protein AB6A40_010142 [Gnathostoma spinigerum]|uniref:Uncharacterized protein n=1 Tax=Gnathostoma spinigerum TaxID=75299 RepID=A0ABD6EUE5_9BILA
MESYGRKVEDEYGGAAEDFEYGRRDEYCGLPVGPSGYSVTSNFPSTSLLTILSRLSSLQLFIIRKTVVLP